MEPECSLLCLFTATWIQFIPETHFNIYIYIYIRWAGHLARMGYKFSLVWNTEVKNRLKSGVDGMTISTPDFKRFFTSVFQTKLNLYPMRARCPAHRSLFYCPSNVWWIWHITELLALQSPPVSCYVVLLTSRIIILISTQPHACSYTLNQCFPP
jgi:hypothetical protein